MKKRDNDASDRHARCRPMAATTISLVLDAVPRNPRVQVRDARAGITISKNDVVRAA